MSIGERLKSAREAKGSSLDEVSRAIKIQKSTLHAIEGNRLHEGLDPVYAKIFLKKYAGYLGLDGAAISKEYTAVYGPIPERPVGLDTEITRKKSAGSLNKIFLGSAIGSIALVGIAFLIYLAVDFSAGLLRERDGQPRKTATSLQKTSGSPGRDMVVEKTPSAPKLLIPRSQPLKLTVKAKSDVWMQLKSDGAVIFQNVLAKGTQESWTAKEELELWTGNAGSMIMHLNGKPLEGIGMGVKKGIKITREGVKRSQ